MLALFKKWQLREGGRQGRKEEKGGKKGELKRIILGKWLMKNNIKGKGAEDLEQHTLKENISIKSSMRFRVNFSFCHFLTIKVTTQYTSKIVFSSYFHEVISRPLNKRKI